MIINIIEKDDITYRVIVNEVLHCTCLSFTNISSHALGKKKNGYTTNIFIL